VGQALLCTPLSGDPGLSGAAAAARDAVVVNDVTADPRYRTAFASTDADRQALERVAATTATLSPSVAVDASGAYILIGDSNGEGGCVVDPTVVSRLGTAAPGRPTVRDGARRDRPTAQRYQAMPSTDTRPCINSATRSLGTAGPQREA
jgi:hypothetical protein